MQFSVFVDSIEKADGLGVDVTASNGGGRIEVKFNMPLQDAKSVHIGTRFTVAIEAIESEKEGNDG